MPPPEHDRHRQQAEFSYEAGSEGLTSEIRAADGDGPSSSRLQAPHGLGVEVVLPGAHLASSCRRPRVRAEGSPARLDRAHDVRYRVPDHPWPNTMSMIVSGHDPRLGCSIKERRTGLSFQAKRCGMFRLIEAELAATRKLDSCDGAPSSLLDF